MTEFEKIELLEKLTRGQFQRSIARDLLDGETVRLCDYMNGTTYYTNYILSFTNLCSRFEKAGIKINIKMGKFGGWWTASAKAKIQKEE